MEIYRGWTISRDEDGIWFVENPDGSFSDFETIGEAKNYIDAVTDEGLEYGGIPGIDC